jgi:hypothetical protein
MQKPTNHTDPVTNTSHRLGLGLAIVLVTGFAFAAVRAWGWKDVARHRNLIVIGPDTADLGLSGAPKQLSVTDGVYAWSVLPGPYTLTVKQPNQKPAELEISIPSGLGGLMLEIKTDPDGDLMLGYF